MGWEISPQIFVLEHIAPVGSSVWGGWGTFRGWAELEEVALGGGVSRPTGLQALSPPWNRKS